MYANELRVSQKGMSEFSSLLRSPICMNFPSDFLNLIFIVIVFVMNVYTDLINVLNFHYSYIYIYIYIYLYIYIYFVNFLTLKYITSSFASRGFRV